MHVLELSLSRVRGREVCFLHSAQKSTLYMVRFQKIERQELNTGKTRRQLVHTDPNAMTMAR